MQYTGRVTWNFDDNDNPAHISGTIIAIGGRYGDIKAVQWDDGLHTNISEIDRGTNWDYED